MLLLSVVQNPIYSTSFRISGAPYTNMVLEIGKREKMVGKKDVCYVIQVLALSKPTVHETLSVSLLHGAQILREKKPATTARTTVTHLNVLLKWNIAMRCILPSFRTLCFASCWDRYLPKISSFSCLGSADAHKYHRDT